MKLRQLKFIENFVMGKRWNGKKMSHGRRNLVRPTKVVRATKKKEKK